MPELSSVFVAKQGSARRVQAVRPSAAQPSSALRVQGLLGSVAACRQCRMVKKRVGADGQEHDIEGAIVHPDSDEGRARGLQVRSAPFCVCWHSVGLRATTVHWRADSVSPTPLRGGHADEDNGVRAGERARVFAVDHRAGRPLQCARVQGLLPRPHHPLCVSAGAAALRARGGGPLRAAQLRASMHAHGGADSFEAACCAWARRA